MITRHPVNETRRGVKMPQFLSDLDLKTLRIEGLASALRPVGLALGNGHNALEIAIVESEQRPIVANVTAAWKARWANRASPVLVVALNDGQATLCGPREPDPPVRTLPVAVAERVCRAALSEPDREAARKFLDEALATIDSPLPGLRNEGLFATHHLQHNLPARPDWSDAGRKVVPALRERDVRLLEALGYRVESEPHLGGCRILRHQESKVALAILVDRGINVDAPSANFNGRSPVSFGLAKADDERLPYVLVLAGSAMRLYATSPGVGAGRRGRTETFLEARLDLIDEARAPYVWLLFSAASLATGGAVETVLEQSRDYAVGVGERLRDRIYDDVVPALAMGVARAMQADRSDIRETYEIALTILFRLLFIAYAEDRRLLPYEGNAKYRLRSLKAKARELATRDPKADWDDQPTYWREIQALFEAVDKGKKDWGVPAYNGGMFASEKDVSLRGYRILGIDLPDAVMGRALMGLLVDDTREGRGPVDFRSLGVREFGTIYEGLLESELAVADTDLTVGDDGAWRPVKRASDRVLVRKGEVYLHDRSGQRKSTGSYFTKSFVVDHLLDAALEPALREHLARLDALDDAAAADRFFDLRVADIAMGSGHFLVAAVDRIERALSGYLARRPLPKAIEEMDRLRVKATQAAEEAGAPSEIEDGQILRRQIARRCVYGVDLNPMAVELARLSIWIHTFVPGLPLSFLDHALVVGNSLVGVATLDEAVDALGGSGLFGAGVRRMLALARQDLERLGKQSDADRAEIQAARDASAEARKKVEPLRKVFDYVVAARIRPELNEQFEHHDPEATLRAVVRPELQRKVAEAFGGAKPTHFPVVFPEVFLRERAGFDAIVGNPPWEKTTLERTRFWGRHVPGLQGLSQREKEMAMTRVQRARPDLQAEFEKESEDTHALKRLLLSSNYPGMGTGDPDLYKAFVWRFWHLLAPDGHLGVVLPRVALQAKGGADFRRELFSRGEFDDLTFLLNNKHWVFDEVHAQYTIVLTALRRSRSAGEWVPFRGPYTSLARFKARSDADVVRFAKTDVLSWTDTAALPLLPSEASARVFEQIRKAPRLDRNAVRDWRARPYREFHTTDDKIENGGVIDVTSLTKPRGFWPVFAGEAFGLWEPDRGKYYGWANTKEALRILAASRLDVVRRKSSPFFELPPEQKRNAGDEESLDCQAPRIAFRNVTRSTDTRTVIAALVPGGVFLVEKAPYLVWPRGDEKDKAYLIGILSSRPLDWYARRFVELDLSYHVLNPFPVPRPPRSSPLWQRAVSLAGRLACPDDRFAAFARAVGVEHGEIDPEAKQDMIHELDAVAAHLYGLNAGQLRHVFETFHEGWEFEKDLRATLKQFDAWNRRLA
jgi:hypothetical protein